LQGDDVFLDALSFAHRAAAIEQIRANYKAIDGSIATSAAYADLMATYFRLPRENIAVVRPGINLHGHDPSSRESNRELTIGYFARIAPEKGLHRLVAAIVKAKLPPFRLRISGWLGQRHQSYLNKALADCAAAGFGDRVDCVACPTHETKVRFMQSLDIFSVPATFHEPKGIYILEAMANGVPVVQPNRGSYPELIQQTGGGLLVEPDDDAALARGIEQLAADPELRRRLGAAGRRGVRKHFTAEVMAQETERVLTRYLPSTEVRS
jgi:glycosyltransferase involved in cell wall biosynthesis